MNILVTGGTGFLGTHLTKQLAEKFPAPNKLYSLNSSAYNLISPIQTQAMFEDLQPDYVFHLAATVGGIGANKNHPGLFFYNNMAMGLNVIHQAMRHNTKKIIFVGTTCAYPKFAPIPFAEHSLYDGYPEETNSPYGIAKRALLTMLKAYQNEYNLRYAYLIPTNLYGPGDNFNPETSHVIPALIKKCIDAQEQGLDQIEVWGTGKATRDFIYVSDVAKALVTAMERYDRPEPLNVGSGQSIHISTLLHFIVQKTGFCGKINHDTSKPDGQPKRQLNIQAIKSALDWYPEINLQDGLQMTIEWYKENYQ